MTYLTAASTAIAPPDTLPTAGHEPACGWRSSTAIEARGLTKRFGKSVAVDHVSFAIERGSIVAFLGPNGAGKTTTLRMLLGLIAPTRGSAMINGRPYRQLPSPPHAVGAVLDCTAAHPGRTARNHLHVHALAAGATASRVPEVLEVVDLSNAADRRVGGFSLGMRQRLALATALLCDPEILILDEPGNGLDPEGVRWLRGLLRDLASDGRTVLVSSHTLAEVARTADSVLMMDHGRLITHAPLAELIAQAPRAIRVRTPRADDLAAALTPVGATVQLLAGDRLQIAGASSEQVGTIAAQAQIPIFETTTQTPDLEEVFLQLTAEANQMEGTR